MEMNTHYNIYRWCVREKESVCVHTCVWFICRHTLAFNHVQGVCVWWLLWEHKKALELALMPVWEKTREIYDYFTMKDSIGYRRIWLLSARDHYKLCSTSRSINTSVGFESVCVFVSLYVYVDLPPSTQHSVLYVAVQWTDLSIIGACLDLSVKMVSIDLLSGVAVIMFCDQRERFGGRFPLATGSLVSNQFKSNFIGHIHMVSRC